MATNEENLSILKDRQGREVALKEVKVNARLHELTAEVDVEQSYINPQNTNIETVYTFPLPIGAVLLGFEVEIGGKKLLGHVIERKKAERDYEEAITDGNSAVMLEETGPGLYTVSIGNLMAKESAVIRYRYALMLSWQGSQLRFLLPTTIAPRYGDAEAAGIQHHKIPKSSLDVEYPFNLSVLVEGSLASAAIASPTHAIAFERIPNGIAAKLSGRALMDRDFVLTLESETAQSACIQTRDGEEHVAVASLRIPPVKTTNEKPLALKVLIDCSGSMGGTSINQARKATLEILNALRPEDSFNVTLFGSECKHIFPHLMPASGKYITEAWNHLENLDADMGGTEMEKALVSTFALHGSENPPCVLLITDGEIAEHEKLVRRAAKSAHRIFTVGVGTAVVDAFLQSLAQTTGGACELVSPQEGMAEKILSQFHRLRQPKLEKIEINWPITPEWATPLPATFFAGDTVHVFAGFKHAINGEVSLHTTVAGQPINVTAPVTLSAEQEMPRLAAAKRIAGATEQQALALSLKYQLLSKWTNYLVIAERDAQAGELPELHQIPQMLAAGWGASAADCLAPASHRISPKGAPASFVEMADIPAYISRKRGAASFDDMDDDIPLGGDPMPPASVASRSVSYSRAQKRGSPTRPRQFIERMEASVYLYTREPKLPETVDDLIEIGLDSDLANEIKKLVAGGFQELGLVVAFLYALSESSISHFFGRNLKRIILKRWKDIEPGEFFNQVMSVVVKDVTADDWGVEVSGQLF